MLTGLLIRLAQSLGLQRDGEQFGLSPLETELRRRLWWQIVHLDLRASEDHGSEPTILDQSFDTRFPLNINDEDIDASMKEPPPEHEGATEMTFDLIRYSVSTTARRLSYVPPGLGIKCRKKSEMFTLEDKERLIEELHQHIEKKYLRHCDMNIPIHWVAGTVLRLVLAKMWLIVHHPLQREDFDNRSLSAETKDRLFRTSVEVIQWSNLLELETSTKKWGWLFRTYVQWHAVAFVLSQLCVRTQGPEVEQAWKVIDEIFGNIGGRVSQQKRGMLWKPLRNLMIKARAARANELEKQRIFPLDGSLGPSVSGVEAAVDPANISNGNGLNDPLGFKSMGNGINGPATLSNNDTVPGTANGLQPYAPMDPQQQQPGIMDQSAEWTYHDPAFPSVSQAFNHMAAAQSDPGQIPPMMGMDGLATTTSSNGASSGADDLNWSDWDEMMKDLPGMGDGEESDFGFGNAGGGGGGGGGSVGGVGPAGPVMGGISGWW